MKNKLTQCTFPVHVKFVMNNIKGYNNTSTHLLCSQNSYGLITYQAANKHLIENLAASARGDNIKRKEMIQNYRETKTGAASKTTPQRTLITTEAIFFQMTCLMTLYFVDICLVARDLFCKRTWFSESSIYNGKLNSHKTHVLTFNKPRVFN